MSDKQIADDRVVAAALALVEAGYFAGMTGVGQRQTCCEVARIVLETVQQIDGEA